MILFSVSAVAKFAKADRDHPGSCTLRVDVGMWIHSVERERDMQFTERLKDMNGWHQSTWKPWQAYTSIKYPVPVKFLHLGVFEDHVPLPRSIKLAGPQATQLR